jgi:hypothetical protein
MGLLRSVRITEARADTPTPNAAGHVLIPSCTPTRDKALLNLAGQMGEPNSGLSFGFLGTKGPERSDGTR